MVMVRDGLPRRLAGFAVSRGRVAMLLFGLEEAVKGGDVVCWSAASYFRVGLMNASVGSTKLISSCRLLAVAADLAFTASLAGPPDAMTATTRPRRSSAGCCVRRADSMCVFVLCT